MKTAAQTYSPPHLIDTAPLALRYQVMIASLFAFMAAGRHGDVLLYSRKVLRLVRVFTRFEAQNVLTKRKLEMLCNSAWRDRVLRELGGMRKLRLWEAAHKRLQERASRAPKPAKPLEPAWLYTPERIAESERLKARTRACAKACAPDRVVRDRVKMDFEGEFRLAPLPRGERAPRRPIVYTANSISDYDWNPIPFAPQSGFGPATVWPVEFRAAMEIEAGAAEETLQTEIEETEIDEAKIDRAKIEEAEMKEARETLPIVSAYDALSEAQRKDLLSTDLWSGIAVMPNAPREEPPHACS